MNKFNKAINAIYGYIYADDPDECKSRIDKILEFNIRLRHSYVDNDKPKTVNELNEEILRKADLCVGFVPSEE